MARAANDLSLTPDQRSALRDALKTRVKTKGECQLWTGSCNVRTGSPVMTVKGLFISVTRGVFLLKSKKTLLPGDTSIKTTCGHPNCTTPEHLVGVMRRFQMLPLEEAIKRSHSARQSAPKKEKAEAPAKPKKASSKKTSERTELETKRKIARDAAEAPKGKKPTKKKPKAPKKKGQMQVVEVPAQASPTAPLEEAVSEI